MVRAAHGEGPPAPRELLRRRDDGRVVRRHLQTACAYRNCRLKLGCTAALSYCRWCCCSRARTVSRTTCRCWRPYTKQQLLLVLIHMQHRLLQQQPALRQQRRARKGLAAQRTSRKVAAAALSSRNSGSSSSSSRKDTSMGRQRAQGVTLRLPPRRAGVAAHVGRLTRAWRGRRTAAGAARHPAGTPLRSLVS